MFNSKRGVMELGVLILFIAGILISIIAVSVYVTASNNLQSRVYSSVKESREEIVNRFNVMDISANDGTERYLHRFEALLRLGPGSKGINLDDLTITISTENESSSFVWRNGTTQNNITGYYTLPKGEEIGLVTNNTPFEFSSDIDLDGRVDYLFMENDGRMSFNLSSAGIISIPIIFNCSSAYPLSNSVNQTISMGDEYVDRIDITHFSCGALSLNESTGAYVRFRKANNGFYTSEYITRDPNHVDSMLKQGEVLKVYFQSPIQIQADSKVRVIFDPYTGVQTTVEFVTPEIIKEYRTDLYPTKMIDGR